MDLTGSLVSTNLKIFPSEELIAFLKNEEFKDDVPECIGKLIHGDTYKIKNRIQNEIKPVDIHLNNNDLKNLDIISKILNNDENKVLDTTHVEVDASEHIDKNKESACETIEENESTKSSETETQKDESEKKAEGPFLTTSDIDWLYIYLKDKRNKVDYEIPYLHALLEGCHIEFPQNEVIKRNPELEARCVKLRAQQEAREYRKMTKSVDNVRMNFPEDSISYQLKHLNRQLIAVGQFIISIFAGFLFGFKGVEWMVGPFDFGFKLLLGVMCALIIALAEIYFLAKKLNEELNVPETTQLGGPPRFVDEKLNENRIKKPIDKPHQD